jgi:hypothetical protein
LRLNFYEKIQRLLTKDNDSCIYLVETQLHSHRQSSNSNFDHHEAQASQIQHQQIPNDGLKASSIANFINDEY